MMKGPKKTVYLMLPLPYHQRLSALAQGCDRTLPAYIRQVLQRYLRYLDAHPNNSDPHWVIR